MQNIEAVDLSVPREIALIEVTLIGTDNWSLERFSVANSIPVEPLPPFNRFDQAKARDQLAILSLHGTPVCFICNSNDVESYRRLLTHIPHIEHVKDARPAWSERVEEGIRARYGIKIENIRMYFFEFNNQQAGPSPHFAEDPKCRPSEQHFEKMKLKITNHVHRFPLGINLLLVLAILVGAAIIFIWVTETTSPTRPRQVDIDGISFVLVDGGCISIVSRRESAASERICVSDFYISVSEVSNSQYQRYFTVDRSPFDSKNRDLCNGPLPVVRRTWKEAIEYAEAVGDHSGRSVRLPTEDEWEYAARAGSGHRPCRDERYSSTCDYVNARQDDNNRDCLDLFDLTAPVDQLEANRFGVKNMLGNASEWVADNELLASVPIDLGNTSSPLLGAGDAPHVIRGGSWQDFMEQLDCSSRQEVPGDVPRFTAGIRLAMDP
jgi:formylglycine-generating enzyme required for sulfatase activity